MMTIRSLYLAALLATIAVPLSAARADEPRPRTASVSGQGEVTAEPDIAYVTLGVESRKPTMAEARSDVAVVIDRVLSLCKSLKIDPKHVNATRVQVAPEYRWNEKDRKRVLLGYLVSRQVQVEVRDLEQLGPLLERAVDAGVNQVNDPVLDSSRRKDLEREALARAVQDARLNAEAVARAAGVKLGTVRALNASASGPVVPLYKSRMMMAEAAVAAPEDTYQPGEMKFSANVSAEYDLVAGP